MIDERKRNRLESWGIIEPEPIMPPDGPRLHPDEFPPRFPAATINRLDALRVPTEHEPFRPLCPMCRRPYDPDCRLQAGLSGCCYQCGPLDWPSVLAHLRAMEEYDNER